MAHKVQTVSMSVRFRPWMKPAIRAVYSVAWLLSRVGVKPEWAYRPVVAIAKRGMVCDFESFTGAGGDAAEYHPGAPVIPGKTYIVVVGDRL